MRAPSVGYPARSPAANGLGCAANVATTLTLVKIA